ncbi:GTP cyclohydrolase [Nocardia tengchongensis]|uniref:GTP cyclohydrolase n=1 Tax=Nocardia tengchongensis TaxID=2055889 RepID=A0ABX8CKI1_9NOCA|nr:GTP cyclohydrolase [Nocardia tengchongensis]QVI19358.1 GTP cyclohydrolase [Nocardia tengchongensis]
MAAHADGAEAYPVSAILERIRREFSATILGRRSDARFRDTDNPDLLGTYHSLMGAGPAKSVSRQAMWASLDHASHRITRKGQQMRVRVTGLPTDIEAGHILAFGSIEDDCLVRIHSQCLYGESLAFQDCDCGPQLERSLDLIQAAGSGILVYLNQEGRGYGLLAKARGYEISEKNRLDTYDSYLSLGYTEDKRDYTLAAQTLAKLGLSSIQLMTNNPHKLQAVRDADIHATVIPLRTPPRTLREADYQAAKRRHGHWLPTDDPPWSPDL